MWKNVGILTFKTSFQKSSIFFYFLFLFFHFQAIIFAKEKQHGLCASGWMKYKMKIVRSQNAGFSLIS